MVRFKTLFILICISNFSYAATSIAVVEKIRGDVTQLAPGENAARLVSIGDKLIEDTSVLTGPKSFVKIKFIDASEINLGPESKIVISEMKKGEAGIISLLKGIIRTEVEKKSDTSKNKLFVKTRTAAMGVRGTVFQAIYNPDNKVTSLLTYRGEVAMTKINEAQFEKLEEENSNLDNAELNKILENQKSVVVSAGQNSMSSDSLKKASLPVKISPAQLNILYKNTDFIESDERSQKVLENKDVSKIKLDLVQVEQKAPLEGIRNSANGDFAPRAGGFVDLKSGLYIAPDADARLDKNQGVYVSENIGNIDSETGSYISPVGIKLDAKKGFIVSGNLNNPKLFAQKNDLNMGVLATDVVVVNTENEAMPFYLNEKFVHDEILLSLIFSEQKLNLNENVQGSPFYSLKSMEDKFKLNFEWKIASIKRTRPLLGASFSNVNFKKSYPANFSMESRKLFDVYLGGMYSLNKYLDFYSKIGFYQSHYANQSTQTSTYNLVRVVSTKVTAGFHSVFFNDSKFPVNFDLWGTFNFRKRLNSIKLKEGTGLGISFGVDYKHTLKSRIGIGIISEGQNIRVQGESGENKHNRSDTGLKLAYTIIY